MKNDLLYQVALTLIPGIGPVQAKLLLQHFEPAEIFKAKVSQLEKIEGIGQAKAGSIKSFNRFNLAEQEIISIEKHGITPLFITDEHYPKRLLNCYDSPTLLFYKGKADLNASKIVAVIGTRMNTGYGKQVTETLIHDLASAGVMVVSGLAYGIDAIAHTAALKNGLPTVGVLAHGLDQLYPPVHSSLAMDMVKHGGGLLTEFRVGIVPDRHNFPSRNRIVAGMSDAVIVVETGEKGGSIITAELADGYNKDVFAVPGRITDTKSSGCHLLVKNNKAMLLTSARQLLGLLNWDNDQPDRQGQKNNVKKQKELFIELTVEEKSIINILKQKESVHIDEINQQSGLSSSRVAAAILSLELQNVVVSLPGKLYRLD